MSRCNSDSQTMVKIFQQNYIWLCTDKEHDFQGSHDRIRCEEISRKIIKYLYLSWCVYTILCMIFLITEQNVNVIGKTMKKRNGHEGPAEWL